MRRRFVVGAAAVLLASALHAQRVQPELRADVLGPKPYLLQPGVGAVIPIGYYVRVGAAVGYLPLDTRLTSHRWHADLITRLTLDPFRQQRWGLSIGGGLTYHRRHLYLAAVADLEGPERRGWLPAFQVGLSGGLRAGLIFRRAVPGRR